MLRELSIKNFAIIDDLNICFSDGLTILSGETGAGKSIIINAVNLLLGSRATAKLIRTGADTAELEAIFQITPESQASKIIKENGYDPFEELLIRRIISRNDRHRIYINGRMATIQVLNSITQNLAGISGQHAHQGLLKEDRHLLILDRFGGMMPLRSKLSRCFHKTLPLIQKLKSLESLQNRQAEQIELLNFQKDEIEKASITRNEDTILEQEKIRLKNRKNLYQTVHETLEELYGREGAILERLTQIKKNLFKASRIDPELSSKAEAIADVTYRTEDIAEEFRDYLKTIEMDENRIEEVDERLDQLNRLKRKYGGSLESIALHLGSIDRNLSEIENLSGQIAETEAALSEHRKKMAQIAETLSTKRKQAAKIISRKVEKELAELKMPQTKFKVFVQPIPAGQDTNPHLTTGKSHITATGIDQATFMIAPNVGETLKPLASIASGGELSRVVLALKAIMADTESVETVIFDEVDAGIGGGEAEVVGQKIFKLSRYHQIICITHLPQIAKFGNHHLKISKRVSDGRTRTVITPLSEKERVKEIARMLGGLEITQTTLEHAREMLGIVDPIK